MTLLRLVENKPDFWQRGVAALRTLLYRVPYNNDAELSSLFLISRGGKVERLVASRRLKRSGLDPRLAILPICLYISMKDRRADLDVLQDMAELIIMSFDGEDKEDDFKKSCAIIGGVLLGVLLHEPEMTKDDFELKVGKNHLERVPNYDAVIKKFDPFFENPTKFIFPRDWMRPREDDLPWIGLVNALVSANLGVMMPSWHTGHNRRRRTEPRESVKNPGSWEPPDNDLTPHFLSIVIENSR